MWHFETKYGLNQCLTDDHRVVYETSKGNLNIKTFEEIRKAHNKSSSGFSGKFYTTFNYNGKGIDLSEFEIRLMCAVICDGTFKNKFSDKSICRINIKKQRKKDRLEWILNNLNKEYRKEQYNPKDLEYNSYLFSAPRIEKEFTSYWYNCSQEQLKIICDEILYWDGTQKNNRKSFSTCVKANADFVQFAFSTQGMRATIRTYNRVGQAYKDKPQYIRKSEEYTVTITERTKVSMGGFHRDNANKTQITEYKTKDGYKYCFTVPSEMLVLRRNKKIFVTHNCGKTSLVTGMLKALEGNNYMVVQCALSGKASANLTDVTGEEGYTIHRLLGVNTDEASDNRFLHNKKNPLNSDVVILDELSMVNIDILYSLIQAIKDGAKLIMLGDIKQLETIGMGNALHDIMLSNTINVVELTKIHRQASASGIITESLKASDKQTWIDRNFFGKKVVGELKDMEYDIIADRRDMVDTIMEYYKEFIKKGISPEDIMILTPKKEEGDTSAWNLSNIVQDYLVKNQKEKHLQGRPKSKYSELYYENDLVMNTVNDYRKVKAIGNNKEGYIPDKESCIPIFNGDMGKVVYIDEDLQYMVVKFNNKDDLVYIPKQDLSAMRLAYSATTNKMQGSSRPYVICAIDYSHYMLLTKEMIYTMLTRAKKYCVMVAENSAYLYAIKHSNISKKQTFLKEELQKFWFNYEELKGEIKPTIYINKD